MNTSSPINISKVSRRSSSKSLGKSSKLKQRQGGNYSREVKTSASMAREFLAGFSSSGHNKENYMDDRKREKKLKLRSKTGSRTYL